MTGLTPEGERALIQRVVDTMGEGAERHIDWLARRIGVWNTVKLTVLGLALRSAGYVVGLISGQLRPGGRHRELRIRRVGRRHHCPPARKAGTVGCRVAWRC